MSTATYLRTTGEFPARADDRRHARDQDRDVVVRQPGREVHDGLVDLAGDLGGRAIRRARQERQQPLLAEHPARVAALGHAVGPERDQIAEAEDALAIVVLALGDHAEQGAADADLLRRAVLGSHDHGRRMAGAGDRESVATLDRAQRRERGRAELLGRALRADRVVDDGEDTPGRRLVAAHDAHRLTGEARQGRGSRSVPGDVADCEEVQVVVLPGVVEIAADLGSLAGRAVARGDLGAWRLRERAGQKALLQGLGDVVLGAVQPGVVDRQGGSPREVFRDGEILLRVVPAGLRGGEREGAEHAPAAREGRHDG